MRRALCSTAFAALVVCAHAAAQKPAALSDEAIYKQLTKSTVWVLPADQSVEGSSVRTVVKGTGSGSLIDVANRLVVTNYHVVRDKKLAVIFFPAYDKQKKLIPEREHYLQAFRTGGGARGTVIATDPKADLALVQLPPGSLPAGVQSLRLARDGVGPTNAVHSVGNPGVSGALWVYTPGKVKAVYHKQYKSQGGDGPLEVDARVVETDSMINPGDSGGPLVNAACELTGVAQGMLVGEMTRPISLFIDVSELKTLLKKHNFTKILSGGPAEVVAAAKDETTAHSDAATAPEDKDKEKERREKAARQMLELANNFKDAPAPYRKRLEDLVKKYEGTKAADEAKELLEKLK